jgi:hypothetical protein
MPGGNMPGRKASQGAAREPRDRGQATARNTQAIMIQRDRLIADITALRAHGAASKFIDNAKQLLTRWWSTASWSGREELLRSADWLIRVAQRQCRPPQQAM